ncbi:MAG: CapA family protein [Magnetococcales bacterium]|nr:CapA family protein [Magnetococcales bacterium]
MKRHCWGLLLHLVVLLGINLVVADGERLIFAGDVLLGREVAREMDRRPGESPWAGLTEIKQATFAMANFEGAVGGEETDCDSRSPTPCFRIDPSRLSALGQAGFSAVGLANNHAGDLGEQGRLQTRSALEKVGVASLDFATSPGFVRLGQHTLGLVALNRIGDRNRRQDPAPSLDSARKLRLARTLADWVVVFIHWGAELRDWPQPEQIELAEWLIGQGADLIIGHHPHVPIAPQCLKGRPVFFSLGNHLFDQKYPQTRQGLMADCRIEDSYLSCDAVTTTTAPGSFFPHRENATTTGIADCRIAAGGGLHLANHHLRPWGEAGRLLTAPLVLEGTSPDHRSWKSAARHLLSLEAVSFEADKPPLLLSIERHPSSLDREEGPRPYVYQVADRGLVARWRGSALAWPLIEAQAMPAGDGLHRLCALHRADSFIRLDPANKETRTALYQWNGFGFRAANDPENEARCEALYRALQSKALPS